MRRLVGRLPYATRLFVEGLAAESVRPNRWRTAWESLALERPIPVSRIAAEFGYQSTCVLHARFPDSCKAIARKELQNRQVWRARLRAGLLSAIAEEPPPVIAAAAKRLGCSHVYLTHYFPDLCLRLREAGKTWRLKQRDAIQRGIEKVVGEMPGASVPDICKATGVRQMFLYVQFPMLYKRIVSGFIAHRDALRKQRRAVLRDDVRKAVAELLRRRLHPTVNNIVPFLSDEAGRDWKRIQEEIDHIIRERAAGGEA
jgi:hypothetical protein